MGVLQARVRATGAKLPDRLFLLHPAGGITSWGGVVHVRSRSLFMTSGTIWLPGDISLYVYIVIFTTICQGREGIGLHLKKIQQGESLFLLCFFILGRWGKDLDNKKSCLSHTINNNTRTGVLVPIKILCALQY